MDASALASKIQDLYVFGKENASLEEPLCTAIGENYFGTMVPLKYLDKLENHAFEDDFFPIPSEYHRILTDKYGDYMTPPPPDKRGGHNLLGYDFGIYQNCSPQDG